MYVSGGHVRARLRMACAHSCNSRDERLNAVPACLSRSQHNTPVQAAGGSVEEGVLIVDGKQHSVRGLRLCVCGVGVCAVPPPGLAVVA
jgi:hypothetical protein